MSAPIPPPITGLDHALVGVRDLEAARAAYARLGFTLTPRGSHTGGTTANYCIMFAHDYVELLGLAGPTRRASGFVPLDRFLARREGLLGVAFATGDAEASFAALKRAGVGPEPPEDLGRDLELAEGTLRPRFKIVHLPAGATPAVPAFLCQHLTPDMIRRPAWLAHANGARGLAAITVIVADPPAIAPAYAKLLGAGAVTPTDDMLTVRVGQASLVFARPEDFARFYAGIELDVSGAPPLIAGMTVVVEDVGRAAACLAENGVAHARDADNAVVVPPDKARGVVLEFIAGRA